mgnify:CR=1 FL=1
MAVIDLTNTPIDIISSTAVSRGVESRLCMIDFSKFTWDNTTHTIFELPAGAALENGHWWIHTALTGGASFEFKLGSNVCSEEFTAVAAGSGGTYGASAHLTTASLGVVDMFKITAGVPVVQDLSLRTAGSVAVGKLVFTINWRDIGSAVTAGYRKGDGTV